MSESEDDLTGCTVGDKENLQPKLEDCDSLALGSATKGGAIKVYGNFSDPEGFKKKIDNAKEVRDYADAGKVVNI